ncbi:UTP--glucose-1-phosphate uridylyltransferase [Anaerolineales bacterium HSG24]|nr:UTP--glucose-1-phosphate uridylyltransferase [Anaerolineales bacterium HSG24]
MNTIKNLALFVKKMKQAQSPEVVINVFEYYYNHLLAEKSNFICEVDIKRVETLPDAEQISEKLQETGQQALSKVVLLKLNGGLGTSMGLDKAKSLLTIKDDLTFLDIIARQALRISTPLVLMNSFNTRDDSLALLKKYPDLWGNIPLDFLQHKIPKIAQETLTPVSWPRNPALEWCPPGHGDIYPSLITSNLLELLLENGYEYAFVSNADNLGASINKAILGYFVHDNLPFMMEVTDRTEADKKGGHLAQRPDGQLLLRESAQCSAEDTSSFQNISRHKYFNTNNLWLNLPALKAILDRKNNILGLPMICNAKTVDPREADSTPVYQLETAMGSMIELFEDAQAIRVPRTRFAPVKTTNDLIAIRSDLYDFDQNYNVVLNPHRDTPLPTISLDPTYYKRVNDFEARFPDGVPSLVACQQLTIKGDIKFGGQVILKGNVTLVNETARQRYIEAGTVIIGE